MHDVLQPTEIAFRRSSTERRTSLRAPGSRLKSLGQQSRSPSLCLIFTRRLRSLAIAIDDATGHAWSGAKKYRTRSRKKSVQSALQHTVGRASRSRDLFLFGLIWTFFCSVQPAALARVWFLQVRVRTPSHQGTSPWETPLVQLSSNRSTSPALIRWVFVEKKLSSDYLVQRSRQAMSWRFLFWWP